MKRFLVASLFALPFLAVPQRACAGEFKIGGCFGLSLSTSGKCWSFSCCSTPNQGCGGGAYGGCGDGYGLGGGYAGYDGGWGGYPAGSYPAGSYAVPGTTTPSSTPAAPGVQRTSYAVGGYPIWNYQPMSYAGWGYQPVSYSQAPSYWYGR
jgi:hypothetical protein